jgi:hypothetical protein
MRRKTQLLIREIARLFVDYRIDDWLPLLSELKRGGSTQKDIATAIEEIFASVPATRKSASDAKRPKQGSRRQTRQAIKRVEVSEGNRSVLEPLRDSLIGKEIAPSAPALQDVYVRVGIKGRMPSARGAAIENLIGHLDQLSQEQLAASLDAIRDLRLPKRGSAEEDYKRWFAIITNDGGAPQSK